jgi:hypothetical protein
MKDAIRQHTLVETLKDDSVDNNIDVMTSAHVCMLHLSSPMHKGI